MDTRQKKKKVLLVNPGVHFQEVVDYGMYPNTAIMVLATILDNAGFSVKVIDGKYRSADDAIKSILDEADNDLAFVGFSVMTVQLAWAYYVSKAIKAKAPEMPIVWGGVHPTLFPEQTVEDAAVDIVAVNDAAGTIAGLALTLSSGGDPAGIPGICYKDATGIRRTASNTDRDTFLNIPHINFSLIDHDRYSRNNNVATEEFYEGRYKNCRAYPVITGLGCAYSCTFCINVILGRRYCFRAAGEIVEQIKRIQKEYGADFIQPMDENFFINKKRTFEFLELLEKEDLKIKWRPQSRADYFSDTYLDIDAAKRLDRSGMVVAAMGVESASQKILDKLNKQLKVDQIIKAMEILSRTNIVPKMNFMVGLPGETEKDIKKTYDLAIRLRKIARKSCVTISPFRPYPGSPLYDHIVAEYGYKPPSNLSEWAKVSEEELSDGRGYESFEHYRWIQKPRKLKYMQSVYTEISWYRPARDGTFLGYVIRAIVSASFLCDFYLFAYVLKAVCKGLKRRICELS